VAAELTDGHVKETSITLTPVSDGRFEIYVNDRKVYDRKETEGGDLYTGLRVMRRAKAELEAELATAPV
jgi:predicted Rdx family selenoprotein